MEFLEGYKSYISGVLIMISAILFYFKIIDQVIFLALCVYFGGKGVVSVAITIHKKEKKKK